MLLYIHCFTIIIHLYRHIASLKFVTSLQSIPTDTDPVSTLKMLLGAINLKHITAVS